MLGIDVMPRAGRSEAEDASCVTDMCDHILGRRVPRMNILIMVVGTRGDIQPFLALGQKLAFSYGHRIRFATNGMYGNFVESCGLEFYPLGGDPEFMSALMVKNRGVFPGQLADLHTSRAEFRNIIFSTWSAATGRQLSNGAPFSPDAIIANPPASGHIHCAEKLGVPLHMVFTMPWSPTVEYPHPFSPFMYRYRQHSFLNTCSFYMMDIFMTYAVLDIINEYRSDILGLEPLAICDRPAMTLHRLALPFCYAWSPTLTPKPRDWPSHIDVVGFMFLEGAEVNYEPPPALAKFLASGPPPVYVGFGSMRVPDTEKLTAVIFSALEEVGQRAVVSQGWAKIGQGLNPVPENVLLIDSVPHRWLFPRCSAVVHHGGAGTVAAGLEAGKPTLVVPFFGDQHIWGQLIAARGLGPSPIPERSLTRERLVSALRVLSEPQVQSAACLIQTLFSREDGVDAAARAFHKMLPLGAMTCDLCPSQIARLFCRDCGLKLSPAADRVIHAAASHETSPQHTREPHRPVDWSSKMYLEPWHSLFSPTGGATRRAFRGGSVFGTLDFLALPITACQLLLRSLGLGLQQHATCQSDAGLGAATGKDNLHQSRPQAHGAAPGERVWGEGKHERLPPPGMTAARLGGNLLVALANLLQPMTGFTQARCSPGGASRESERLKNVDKEWDGDTCRLPVPRALSLNLSPRGTDKERWHQQEDEEEVEELAPEKILERFRELHGERPAA